ncbi:MAG: metal ABC transporter permease [Treponema sp.]|jgi:zinc transport system permease protein|nr:metal ABC transporter permease [Treponema sp.]
MFDLFETLREMASYPFLVRAFVVGALVSICAALLGVSLVLKRYSMIGDGLSHVGFGALAAATALHAAPLAVAIPLCLAAAFLLLRLGEKHLIKGDAAIALISTSSLALGVVLISQTTGMNTDVCNYLFGSILAMNKHDVYISVALSVVVLSLFILFYHKVFAITFDETFARASGLKTGRYTMLIAALTAVTIVLGMRMMGAMLISALIIFPALTSMRLCKTFRGVSISAVCVSIVCYGAGIVISYVYAMPTGASVVLVNIAAFALFWGIQVCKRARRPPQKTAPLAAASLAAALFLAACSGAKAQDAAAAAAAAEKPGAAESPASAAAAEPAPARETPLSQVSSEATVPAKESPVIPKDVIEIKEKLFIAQTNDVYLNADDYLGKTLKLEGLFKQQRSDRRNYCFVIRYGPGCCGYDGSAGFEVEWESKNQPAVNYPADDTWVEAIGTLKRYEEDGVPYLYLALSSLRTPQKRGLEYVTQ